MDIAFKLRVIRVFALHAPHVPWLHVALPAAHVV
jgi:hypothetical protein